jgi:GNAT superfamily N-acetyltransferase
VNDNPAAWEIEPPRLPDETPEIRALADAYGLLSTWPRRPDYLDHLLEAGRVVVARGAGGVAGYGGAFVGQFQAHLTDLFVRPDAIGRGAGGAILAALELTPARTSTFASADPRAHKLYRGLGLHELDKLSYLVGRVEEVEELKQRVERRTSSPAADAAQAIKRHLKLRSGLHGAATISFLVQTSQPLSWASGYAWLRVASDRVCVGPIGSLDETAGVSVVTDALVEGNPSAPQCPACRSAEPSGPCPGARKRLRHSRRRHGHGRRPITHRPGPLLSRPRPWMRTSEVRGGYRRLRLRDRPRRREERGPRPTHLSNADGGTDVLAVHDGLPPGISPADNEAGWRSALERLADLVETD